MLNYCMALAKYGYRVTCLSKPVAVALMEHLADAVINLAAGPVSQIRKAEFGVDRRSVPE